MLFLLAIFFGAISFYYLKENKKVNQKLEAQNKEIAEQKNRIEKISIKAEEAHQAKLNFFTNISHEFRTPLTLMVSPLEEILESSRLSPESRFKLQLVQRNVMRLYRLVNQLMDFRKIEFNKMQVQASENDLVSFTKEITDSFREIAKKKNIQLGFFTSEKSIAVWFDITMIDKVIFNLLSNAFKFTRDNGFISVSINKTDRFAIILIEDNGVGMTKDAIDHAFEPFFQGEYENFKGTGLGLALSKDLVEMHKGQIKVTSEKWKGTKFEICLPLGKEHLPVQNIETIQEAGEVITEDKKIFTTELVPLYIENGASTNLKENKDQCILIVEDNPDLRHYLKLNFSHRYDVIETDNGNEALTLAMDNIPDLIICDVVLPGKNGIYVAQALKNDIRTSHIPIILLTSRSDEKQQLEGMETKADAYITKPFSLPILERTMNNLIANREKIKSHYSGEIFTEEKSHVIKKIDRKFISDFSAIVENNLANDKFTVEDICKEMAISKVQLYRKVKSLLNCSANEYILTVRLQKAKHYLQHDDMPISDIAIKTGFSSAAYFSTVFKSKFGIKPSEFKNGRAIT